MTLQEKYSQLFAEELERRRAGDPKKVEKREISELCAVIVQAIEGKITTELCIPRDKLEDYFSVGIELFRDEQGMWGIRVKKNAEAVEILCLHISKMCYSSKDYMFAKIGEELKKFGVEMSKPKEGSSKTTCFARI